VFTKLSCDTDVSTAKYIHTFIELFLYSFKFFDFAQYRSKVINIVFVFEKTSHTEIQKKVYSNIV